MASSSTEIANLALGHCGVGKEIANLDTENSAEAKACRRFYDIAMESLQEDFPYAFLSKEVALGLVTEDPSEEYKYSYQVPSDSVRLGRILSGNRNDDEQTKVRYKIVRGTSGREIWTDQIDACMEYQVLETDTGRFGASWTLMISYKLAELISPSVTGGDPFGLGNKAKANYEEYEQKAQSNSLHDGQEELIPDSEMIRMREGDVDTGSAQDWIAFPINFRVS